MKGGFLDGYSRIALIKALVGNLFWSGLSVSVLLLIRRLDHGFVVSGNVISALLVPTGIIHLAVGVNGVLRLRRLTWKTVLSAAFAIGCCMFFLFVLLQLNSQSGPITNR